MPYSFLSFGSNLGERKSNINAALEKLSSKVQVIKASGLHETPAWGRISQPKFLNMVALISTDLKPQALLEEILRIESSLGRERASEAVWNSRTIDVDILTIDSLIINDRNLKVPHPHFHKRIFVLKPFSEIAPEYVVPGFYDSIVELKESLDENY